MADIIDIATGRPRGEQTPPETAPDILTLCAAFDGLQEGKRTLFDRMPDGYERECAVDRVELEQEPMVYRLTELRATTIEEHRARARTLWNYLGSDQLNEDAASCLWDAQLTAAVLRDLAAEAAPADDAALLDLCRQFDADTREMQCSDALVVSQCAIDPALALLDDDALDPLADRWHDTLAQITALPARTTTSIRAKGGALGNALMQKVAIETGVSFEEQAEDYELLAMSLVRDFAGEGTPKPSPDAELIRLCAEAMHQNSLWESDDLEASDRAGCAWFELTGVIATMPARTVEGMRAKAGIIRQLMAPMQPRWADGDTHDQTPHDPLVWSLVNDLSAVQV